MRKTWLVAEKAPRVRVAPTAPSLQVTSPPDFSLSPLLSAPIFLLIGLVPTDLRASPCRSFFRKTVAPGADAWLPFHNISFRPLLLLSF